MVITKREPGIGYVDTMLWLPKNKVPSHAIAEALTFSVNTGRDVMERVLYYYTKHHIVVPRQFIPEENWKKQKLSKTQGGRCAFGLRPHHRITRDKRKIALLAIFANFLRYASATSDIRIR